MSTRNLDGKGPTLQTVGKIVLIIPRSDTRTKFLSASIIEHHPLLLFHSRKRNALPHPLKGKNSKLKNLSKEL